MLGEKRPAKKESCNRLKYYISRFFRIAPQPAKRQEEAGFNIETNQRFFKEQEIRRLMKP